MNNSITLKLQENIFNFDLVVEGAPSISMCPNAWGLLLEQCNVGVMEYAAEFEASNEALGLTPKHYGLNLEMAENAAKRIQQQLRDQGFVVGELIYSTIDSVSANFRLEFN